MADKNTDKLAAYIERWIAEYPRRNIQMLARLSGVSYPTIRRLLQGECDTTLENALSLLNLVASLHETLDYLKSNSAVSKFYERVTANTTVAREDILERYIGREAFWIINLGLTIGATRDRVEKLLGATGLVVLEELLAEGIIKEELFGVYKTAVDSQLLFFDNRKVSRATAQHVAEIPYCGRYFEQVIVCNVSEKGLDILMDSLKEAFQKGAEAAKNHEGDIFVAFSYVGKEVVNERGRK